MAWNEAVVTNEGLKLLSECMTEGNIIITRAVSGEGYADPISLMAQKDVSSNLHPLNIAYIHTAEGIITVNVRIQNNGTDTSYTIRQIGLFAKKDTADNEILFALIQDSNGEVIPSSKENPEYLSEFDFVIPISNSENINANITPNTFATMEDVSETEKVINGHISDKSNPHSVTKSQVGLDKVENKSSEIIRSEITEQNVVDALGFKPPSTNTTYSNFVKSGSGAKFGLVPAPSTTAGTTKYLREDGTWATPPDTNTTYSAAVASPLVAGTVAVGTSTKYAREDHVHPAQTSVADNAGSATKLATARNINGISFDGTKDIYLPSGRRW